MFKCGRGKCKMSEGMCDFVSEIFVCVCVCVCEQIMFYPARSFL